MSPILLGLAVMCWRVRQRPVSRANPRSPRQRSERSTALRVRGIDVEVLPAGGLLDRDVDADARAVVAEVGEGGQVSRDCSPVQGGQGVDAGGGDVVHRAGLGIGDPQREPVRGKHCLDVAAVGVRFAGVPDVDDLTRTLMVFSRHRSAGMIVPSNITWQRPASLARSSAWRRSGACAARTVMTSSRYRYAVAREMPWSWANASGLVRSRNQRRPITACQKHVSARREARPSPCLPGRPI